MASSLWSFTVIFQVLRFQACIAIPSLYSIMGQTQGLRHTRQAVFHLSYTPQLENAGSSVLGQPVSV